MRGKKKKKKRRRRSTSTVILTKKKRKTGEGMDIELALKERGKELNLVDEAEEDEDD